MYFSCCWIPTLPSPIKIPGRHFNPNIILQINESQQQLFHLWTIPNQALMTKDHSSSCAWVRSSETWILGFVQFVVESAHVTKFCFNIRFLADSVCGKGRTSRLRPWTEKPFSLFNNDPLGWNAGQAHLSSCGHYWAVCSRAKKRCWLPGISALQFLQEQASLN